MIPRLLYARGKAAVLLETGLAPEPVWTFLEKREICCSYRYSNPEPSSP